MLEVRDSNGDGVSCGDHHLWPQVLGGETMARMLLTLLPAWRRTRQHSKQENDWHWVWSLRRTHWLLPSESLLTDKARWCGSLHAEADWGPLSYPPSHLFDLCLLPCLWLNLFGNHISSAAPANDILPPQLLFCMLSDLSLPITYSLTLVQCPTLFANHISLLMVQEGFHQRTG